MGYLARFALASSLFMALLLSACGTGRDLFKEVETGAAEMDAETVRVPGEDFDLLAMLRVTEPGGPLVVYLEGDGRAWRTRRHPSTDPTPHQPVALWLARRDPVENRAWLARPCQYVMAKGGGHNCETRYWTGARYGERVLSAMNDALDRLAREVDGPLHLVGFSGGGTVAALLAARRDDVASLRTVAGNLDHEVFTEHHGVSPLEGSLNPVQYSKALKRIPQIHFAGKQDSVIVPAVIESFHDALEDRSCMQIRWVEAAHREGWRELWPDLAAEKPRCR